MKGLLFVAASAWAQPSWQRVPLRTAAIKNAAPIGGEGCQVVRMLEGCSSNPDLLLLGADVGGIYRSLDGGRSFHPAMVGWNSRGSTGFVCDPYNSSHIIGIGGNSNDFSGANGIHVSYDMASSWNFTHPVSDAIACLNGQAAVFDPSSYNAATGMTMVAYYSSNAGLWRSTDGGVTWTLINPYMFGQCLAVDSQGRLYGVSNDYRTYGLYTCGQQYVGAGNCTRLSNNYYGGLNIPQAKGDPMDTVYASSWVGVVRSTDHGQTWQTLGHDGLPPYNTLVQHIAVSPANASYMSVWWSEGAGWNSTHAVSHDGGATWATVGYDNTLAFMPYNGRDGKPVWHPTNASLHWNAGGDWVTASTDGGLTLSWSSNGYNVVMPGGVWNFNLFNPDILFTAFQDYAGAFTVDGGDTWMWTNVSGLTWGGMDYGGYALNATTLWAGDSPSWTGPRTLTISFDGGYTWQKAVNATGGTGLVYGGPDASYGCPDDPLVGFASDWRTADGGRTWSKMVGVSAVITHDYTPGAASHTLYGMYNGNANQATVVASSDKGVTWSPVLAAPSGTSSIADLAHDWQAQAFYIVTGSNSLYKCTATAICTLLDSVLPQDQTNSTQVFGVAVDPVVPSVVYVGQAKNVYLASNAVSRSTDGGVTWENMILTTPLSPAPDAPLQGPHEVTTVRVDPSTRWVWAGGECFGLWKAPPPA